MKSAHLRILLLAALCHGALLLSAPAAQELLPASVPAGRTAILTVTADGTKPFTYQWRKDGLSLPGATDESLRLAGVTSAHAGTYDVQVSNSAGSVASVNAIVLTIEGSAQPGGGRLINLSILTPLVTPGEDFTLGYVVGGSGTSGGKPLVLRAVGPSLSYVGVFTPLADPRLELFTGTQKTGENDNWGGSASLAAAMAAVGAFAYYAPDSRDAATAVSVPAGDNSIRISAAGSATGNVLAEIYDATPSASFTATTPRLINVSVLKQVGTGFTMGFVIGGNGTRTVLIRAIGPALAGFTVSSYLTNPELTLYSGTTPIAYNDDWGGGATLTAQFSSVAAFALPAASRDAALVATLAPGSYSVRVTGIAGATGLVLAEVYELP